MVLKHYLKKVGINARMATYQNTDGMCVNGGPPLPISDITSIPLTSLVKITLREELRLSLLPTVGEDVNIPPGPQVSSSGNSAS